MTWWIEQQTLRDKERCAVGELAETAAWLGNVSWRIDPDLRLVIDFDVEWTNETYGLTMAYSSFHPHAPMQVCPRDGRRLSNHQYGAGGELCLEHRADNWDPSITGAVMMESAFRLISGERQPDGGAVASAHQISIGRMARGSVFRFLLPKSTAEALSSMTPGEGVDVELFQKCHGGTFTLTLAMIGSTNVEPAWSKDSEYGGSSKQGRAVRFPAGKRAPRSNVASVEDALRACGREDDAARFAERDSSVDLVIVTDAGATLYFAFDSDDGRSCADAKALITPEECKRQSPEYVALLPKRVAIVGCGSVGSKVATMLARAGVGAFVLVDDDLFLPGNLVRNDLGQRAVGVHKVDAVKARIVDVGGTDCITVHRTGFGGQESAAMTENVMRDLAGCDIVIDATADPRCFNMCAAVVRHALIPFVFAEVYAGGIGGLVARLRPGREPDPQTTRQRIDDWCTARAGPAPIATSGYGGRSVDNAPMVADDAEVTVIAAHAARMVIDNLLRGDASIYAQAAYFIGLSADWIFEAPFDTWPIDLGASTEWRKSEENRDPDATLAAFLAEVLPGANAQHTPAD